MAQSPEASGRDLAPSPIARFLLGLAERGANGSVEVGGRTTHLRDGRVVEITAAEGDGDLMAFLRDSGRVADGPLESCRQKAREESLTLAEVLQRQRLLSADAIEEVTRGLWLDRLVRGMARASAEGREPSPLFADPHAPPADRPSTSLVSLVLDALERRAADEDAGRVGARAGHRLEWLESPHAARARRWARFQSVEADRPAISALLKTEPAAAPRIAALVRAGMARIVSPHSLPPPPRRTASIPATRMTVRTPPLGSVAEQEDDKKAPSRAARATPGAERRPAIVLDPGLSPVFADASDLDIALPPLPELIAPLDDPLSTLERAISSLEQSDAAGPRRAAAWRGFAEAWEERFGSIEEAARAYREAAAADPKDIVALERASDRCAAIGQADLAVAYARARVQLEPAGPKRSVPLLRYALLCRRLGKLSEALGAARKASTGAPDDPAPPALAAHLWQELGRPEDAANAATEAANRIRKADPARALSLIAMARGLDPGDPSRADAYANELVKSGLIEAAIAVRADAVRRTRDKDQRRALIMEAAEQAEDADRPELAAALLTRAFDAEPHLHVLYEPLDADLALAGVRLERALILEEMAAAAPEETRGQWLRRAAEVRLELPGDGVWEAELRVRALELDPQDSASLKAIREQAVARDDDRLLADALERALLRGRWGGTKPQAAMLEELARLADDALSAPLRAEWAWKRLAAINPDAAAPARQLERLAPALDAHERDVATLEADLKRAKGDARSLAARRLADLLRDDPNRRGRAVALFREVIAAQGESVDPTAIDSLERLLQLTGETYHEAQTIMLRAQRATVRADRIQALTRLASLHVLRRDLRQAAIVCRQILTDAPGHREASIRLRRVASRLTDRELLREALAAEVHAKLPPDERARVLTALALELEAAHGIEEAISCAEAALTADSQSAEAALLVVRHLEAVSEPRAALGVVRALFGDAPPILEAWVRVARDSGEREIMREALDAWARVAPYDPEPTAMRLTAFPSAEPDDSVAAAIEEALQPERITPSLARPIARAVERLGERDPKRAAELAVRASDAFGPHGDALRELASRIAAATGDPVLQIPALERKAASQTDDLRVETLHELAKLHHSTSDRAAEARTHLRVLAVHPHEPRSLSRLETLYAETGEPERLMAVLTLQLESAEHDARIQPLLKLAAACVQLRGDHDRAEAFLRDAWTPDMKSDAPLFTAAAALVRLGRARRAVEMLRAAGRLVGPERAGAIFLRAVQTAVRKVEDFRLALATAMEGLDHAAGSGPLLIAFEQMALELKDVAAADRVYRSMIDRAMGPHGRRALAYRRARWLERAGATRAALEGYVDAFAMQPHAGVVFSSIERLARAEGELESLVQATQRLGTESTHPNVRAARFHDAAAILETEMSSPERAFDLLAEHWDVESDTETEGDLVRLAKMIGSTDENAGNAAFDRLTNLLQHRADDAWMAEQKARLLVRKGRLEATGLLDLNAAVTTLKAALSALHDEDADEELTAKVSVELARWLLDAGKSDAARKRIAAVLLAHPAHEGALRLQSKVVAAPRSSKTLPPGPSLHRAGKLPSVPRLPTATPAYGLKPLGKQPVAAPISAPEEGEARDTQPGGHSRQPSVTKRAPRDKPSKPLFELVLDEPGEEPISKRVVRETSEALELSLSLGSSRTGPPEPRFDAPLASDTVPDGIERRERWSSSSPPVAKPSQPPPGLAWISKPVDDEDPAALIARAQSSAPAEAAALLHLALTVEPWRVPAWTALVSAASASEAATLEHVARSVLATIDSEMAPGRSFATVSAARIGSLIRDSSFDTNRALWRLLWEHARPLFRDKPSDSVSPNDRVTRIATTPPARAFAAALDALSIEELPPFYFNRSGGELKLVRTVPPAILAGAGFAETELAMRFELGRALELTRNENLLVATLDETRARMIIMAVRAAFGPAETAVDVAPKAAAVASDLWDTLPSRPQKEARELLEAATRWEDYAGTHAAVIDAGNRAGLVACGDLTVAVATLAEHVIADVASLETALKTRAATELMRFALTKLVELEAD